MTAQSLTSQAGSGSNLINWFRALALISPRSTVRMYRGSCTRIPSYDLTIGYLAPEDEPRVIETTTEHHPHVADPQICDHATEAGVTDDESQSDDEFFDCIQLEDGPTTMEPVPSSVTQPAGPPIPAQMDSGEADGSEPQPNPVENLPQARGMYRLLNLVTERGTGGISE
jgi:hypothetical protein